MGWLNYQLVVVRLDLDSIRATPSKPKNLATEFPEMSSKYKAGPDLIVITKWGYNNPYSL